MALVEYIFIRILNIYFSLIYFSSDVFLTDTLDVVHMYRYRIIIVDCILQNNCYILNTDSLFMVAGQV